MSNEKDMSPVITENKLKNYHENFVYPYLNGSSHTGFTPVGTVISYFGETAPTHFLICDGTAYNKADYPQLWTHLSSLTDTTPYVVDGDNTKFKVPDLRGEFLRGTGTNGHSGQGSGGDVGEHQDATELPIFYADTPSGSNSYAYLHVRNSGSSLTYNADSWIFQSSGAGQCYWNTSKEAHNNYTVGGTSRPTNTSVLFCIAVKDIYIDYALDGFPCEITNPQDKQGLQYDATSGKWVNGAGGLHEYSTTEKVVGTWIDGRPVYEKTFVGDLLNRTQFQAGRNWVRLDLMPDDADLCYIVRGFYRNKYNTANGNMGVNFTLQAPILGISNQLTSDHANYSLWRIIQRDNDATKRQLAFLYRVDSLSNVNDLTEYGFSNNTYPLEYNITVQYIKTTDTPSS